MKLICPKCKNEMQIKNSNLVKHPDDNVLEVRIWCQHCLKYTQGKMIGISDLEPDKEIIEL